MGGKLLTWKAVGPSSFAMPPRILRFGPAIYYVPGFEAGPGGTRVFAPVPIHFADVEELPSGLDAIICTSDLQGREVGLNGRPGRLLGEAVAEELQTLFLQEGISMANAGVILAGDYYAASDADKRGVSGDVDTVWEAFSRRARWVCGVLGNHDRLETNARRSLQHAPLGHTCDGLRIAGLDSIIGDPQKPGRRDEAEYLKDLRRCLRANPQILVLHESPAVADEPGSEAIAQALQDAEDLLVVCGHVRHREPLHELSGGVQVLNVDGRVVVLRRTAH
jgi:hypothetical protein